MSTNYYRYTVCDNACGHCSVGKVYHIGKSYSYGGVHIRTYPDEGIIGWRDWKHKLLTEDDYEIRNEYGIFVPTEDLIELVEGSTRWIKDEGADRLDFDGFPCIDTGFF